MAESATGQDEANPLFWLATQVGKMGYLTGEGGRDVLGMLLASQNPYPTLVYPVAKYRSHLSHFWENIIFTIPTL